MTAAPPAPLSGACTPLCDNRIKSVAVTRITEGALSDNE